MDVTETKLAGVLLIKPKVWGDNRGFFKEIFQLENYQKVGVHLPFVQDNVSRSCKGVIRGLHYQANFPQGKLVSCSRGTIVDVVVDIDPKSSSYLQHIMVELSEDNHNQLYIPPGYAHGFCVLSDVADFHYKCTELYHSEDEFGLRFDDPALEINWPVTTPLVSDKDLNWPLLGK